jgi:hypothetical protein
MDIAMTVLARTENQRRLIVTIFWEEETSTAPVVDCQRGMNIGK